MSYEGMVCEVVNPWCWCCGSETALERAHLMAGGGKGLRVEDRRAVNLLCPSCHRVHQHSGPQLSNAHMLWLKRERDPGYWDPSFISWFWIGIPPEPVEPTWQRDKYQSIRGGYWNAQTT